VRALKDERSAPPCRGSFFAPPTHSPNFLRRDERTSSGLDSRQSMYKCPQLTQSGNPSSYKAVIEANESGRLAVEKLEPFHPGLLVIVLFAGVTSKALSVHPMCLCDWRFCGFDKCR
jgi:hypothetical protein